MSYNRRGRPPLASVGSVGQRRPQATNFVSGGQRTWSRGHTVPLNRNAGFQQTQGPPQANRPQQQNQGNQQHQQQQQQQQQKPQQNVTPQKPQVITPQKPLPTVTPPKPQVVTPQIPVQQVQIPVQKTMQEAAQEQVAQLQTKTEAQPMEVGATEPAENGEAKQKPFWMKKTVGKISKAERVRRRNFRLKKVLQPKNALMVLNELIGSTAYTVAESKTGYNQDLFDATLSYDGEQFVGTGKSKVAAKTAAAEKAIKSIIVKKINAKAPPPSVVTSMEEDVKTDQEKQEEDLSWSHIASFAIHKLFTAWDEDGNLVENFSADNANSNSSEAPQLSRTSSFASLQTVEQKPAKKLPENAAQLNPVMLLNQMYPNAKYEEVAKSGQPPNIQFTISCSINGQVFTGIGQNKKAARKQAALEVCRTMLNIQYPPEVASENTMEMQ